MDVWTGRVMFEKRWAAVPPQLFTSNGTPGGVITVMDSSLFKVKQLVNITANTLPNLNLEVKSVPNDVTIVVGPIGANIFTYTDISAYTTALSGAISANEQKRSSVPVEEINRAVYEEEPTVALRNVLVDKHGRKIDSSNPLPTTATISGDVTIGTDGFNPTDPDSMLATGSEDGTKTGIKHAVRVDSELDLRVGISDGANKAAVNISNELSVVDQLTRNKLDTLIASLAATLNVSDSAAQALLTTIIASLASIDAGIPAALGQTTMANSMPVTLATNQSPIPVTASLSDEPIKISGTDNGTPTGTEYTFVNNRVAQILAAKDSRSGTITYADFGTKDQRVLSISYTAPSIGTGPGFTAVKSFTYTLVGNRYRRDTPGNWTII